MTPSQSTLKLWSKNRSWPKGLIPQSSTLYIYYIYIELACTQFPFFQNLPYESTASVPNENKDIEFWLSAHIVRAYPYMELKNTKDEQIASLCMQRFVTFKILYNWIRRFCLSAYSDPAEKFSPPALNWYIIPRQAQSTLILYLCNIYIYSILWIDSIIMKRFYWDMRMNRNLFFYTRNVLHVVAIFK